MGGTHSNCVVDYCGWYCICHTNIEHTKSLYYNHLMGIALLIHGRKQSVLPVKKRTILSRCCYSCEIQQLLKNWQTYNWKNFNFDQKNRKQTHLRIQFCNQIPSKHNFNKLKIWKTCPYVFSGLHWKTCRAALLLVFFR